MDNIQDFYTNFYKNNPPEPNANRFSTICDRLGPAGDVTIRYLYRPHALGMLDEITFGVGYSSEDHLTGQLRVSESNLFGRGLAFLKGSFAFGPGLFPVLILAAEPAAHDYCVVIREKSAICKKVPLMRASRLKRLRRSRSSSAITMTWSKKASTGPRSRERDWHMVE